MSWGFQSHVFAYSDVQRSFFPKHMCACVGCDMQVAARVLLSVTVAVASAKEKSEERKNQVAQRVSICQMNNNKNC